MREVVRLPRAEEDLVQIWRCIADDNETAADRLLDRFAEVARKLASHPEAGRLRSELADGMRSFLVGNYVLFYRAAPAELVLVRVLSRYLDIDEIDFSTG
ncbi:type II toxin-antitoxin system RelE/ParE family toxin [Shinella sp. CPCC 101442]|uniref:type II toxin-antitoxin system RelE/ParE family toxin n=1 Tax=Shinella sp. CPCC 101442 TaxID=2932265 RepID=UPI002152F5D0|nr:type II toxin-antitoxin system RelE/ParE family toxin [Shinella sp. CPCC 101442]MCR6500310.1 type II toxin-antitoxin system RelE/ParE family toxin [Shinella sp. CPCC 101442]